MPRSSFSDNPLLRVSRPVSACSRCRSAKVKCDGKLPACTACEKAGRDNECSAANDQFARGKERSYVAALELRIEKMQRRLAFARSRKASLAQHASGPLPPMPQPDRKDSLANIQAAMYRKAARSREYSDVNSLMSDFGFLSVNATTRDFEPSASNMTFARLVLAAATNDPLPRDGNWHMPSRQAAIILIQYYMTNIYSLYPAFSETALYNALEQVYSMQDRIVKDSDYWLLYMVLAISSSAQSQVKNDQFYVDGVFLAARALKHADQALMPGYTTQIQSLILLTQYSTLDPAHFDSWHLIGFTCRAVIDLGFHQDPPMEQMSDKSLLDMRRKTFYCVYSLDRSISMVLTRAFSFTDAAANVAFPRPSSFGRRTASIAGQPPPPPGAPGGGAGCEPAALLLFQLRRAQSHWYQHLSQSGGNGGLPDENGNSHDAAFAWRVCHQMQEWAERLPRAGLPPGVRGLFDLELRYSLVYCVSPSAKSPPLTDYDRLFIFEHAAAYLDHVYEITHHQNSHPHSHHHGAADGRGGGGGIGGGGGGMAGGFYSFHDALRVFFMASQFVAVLRDAEDFLLSGVVPALPYSRDGGGGTAVMPPRLPPRRAPPPGGAGGGGVDNLERSIACLERTASTLAKYGERWDDSVTLRRSFDHISRHVVERLRLRRSTRHHNHLIKQEPPSPPPLIMHQQQTSQPQMAGVGDMRWVEMNVEAMMRGGGGPRV
ncbi:putative positive regulator of purine utilization [Rosellinia necatrix]|uniref:Putative positive regulator of purine utilization n=1 Tax=Rosellinia necatrix TaxID=77044 RepID=A0A1S7UIG8_ROSNE|nr:putative positive regulator of purine utilization [Rosellinia necatrix]